MLLCCWPDVFLTTNGSKGQALMQHWAAVWELPFKTGLQHVDTSSCYCKNVTVSFRVRLESRRADHVFTGQITFSKLWSSIFEDNILEHLSLYKIYWKYFLDRSNVRFRNLWVLYVGEIACRQVFFPSWKTLTSSTSVKNGTGLKVKCCRTDHFIYSGTFPAFTVIVQHVLTLYFLLICRINGALLLTRCESLLLSQSFVDSSVIWLRTYLFSPFFCL